MKRTSMSQLVCLAFQSMASSKDKFSPDRSHVSTGCALDHLALSLLHLVFSGSKSLTVDINQTHCLLMIQQMRKRSKRSMALPEQCYHWRVFWCAQTHHACHVFQVHTSMPLYRKDIFQATIYEYCESLHSFLQPGFAWVELHGQYRLSITLHSKKIQIRL
jgi:hypothetical protein